MAYASDFVEKFTDPLDRFMTDGVTSLAAAVKGPLYAGATLYIVIFGIFILLGYVRAPISDFIGNVLKITIVVTLATKVGDYNYYVKDLFFTHLPEGISNAIGKVASGDTSATSVSNGKAFDDVTDQLIAFSTAVYSQWDWDNWYPLLAAAIVLLGLIPIAALLAVVLLAKVGLTLILVLGPVFIPLFLFRPTQSFTSAWISALVNFVALQVLSITFITLMLNITTGFIDDAQTLEGGAQAAAALSIFLIFVLALILAVYLPTISAHLAGGGFQIGSSLINSSSDPTRTVGSAAGSGATRAARWGWNKVRGLGQSNTVKKTG
ncbi:hypothetical protein CU102_03270 [Phyllobacterium brassicacearum]|uniref:Conjugal transfer protein TrbL n=1 Tax=Phyllobacterium brassicacearum TaxID=314235 RepID=A0A2P7BUI2_9HYPH|nr:type IV secretion system protein [Phyllobacterium brassicacearum]PSH70133.1 hypothetical protein CU102_03270 [Phyllobacterium brassicacearum]TDQ33997.1 type IV secretion system protein VirB6 [Phyllobacterium brassicacearum]